VEWVEGALKWVEGFLENPSPYPPMFPPLPPEMGHPSTLFPLIPPIPLFPPIFQFGFHLPSTPSTGWKLFDDVGEVPYVLKTYESVLQEMLFNIETMDHGSFYFGEQPPPPGGKYVVDMMLGLWYDMTKSGNSKVESRS